jgi:DNA polymerase III subunit delta
MPNALVYLAAPEKTPPARVCVLFGDELFLQRQVLASLRAIILPGEDAEFSCQIFSGEDSTGYELEWQSVMDELNTVALFGGDQRLVIIDKADDFVSRYREKLEAYLAKPSQSGILIMTVKSWPSNTRLYKSIDAKGLPIECKTPSEAELLRWLTKHSDANHGAKLDPDAAELLYEIVGDNMGRLDQELEKLALIARTPTSAATDALAESSDSTVAKKPDTKSKPLITRDLVEEAVGGWRARSAWDLSKQMNLGNAADALLQLQRLYDAGEDPIPLLAMVSSSLRKLAAATRMADIAQSENRRGEDLKTLLTKAGITYRVQESEEQLKQISRPRGRQILDWLIKIDLALKGRNSRGHKARLMLEELIVKLSKQAVRKV